MPLNNLSFLRLAIAIVGLAASMLLLLRAYLLLRMPLDLSISIFGQITVLHAMTMQISQGIEMEHRFWYWTSLVWLSYIGFKRYDLTRCDSKAFIFKD